MAEEQQKSENHSKPESKKELNRRDFIKYSAVAAAGGLLVREGKQISQEEIQTKEGIFYPSYETHTLDLNEERIPPSANMLFMELISKPGLGPESLVNSIYQRERFLTDKVLRKLSTQSTELVLGDVNPGLYNESFYIMGGEFLAGLTLLNAAFADVMLGKTTQAHSSRREFLKGTAKVGAAWALSPMVSLATLAITSWPDSLVQRIGARISGLASHLHPEEVYVFFRSLVMTEKLLVAAEDYKTRTGLKPKIAYRVGAGHGNIEDFLQAGQDFCRALILAHPKGFLEKVVELNGGAEKFCSIYEYTLPDNLDNLNETQLKESVTKETVTRQLVDEKLLHGLVEKLEIPAI